MKFLFKLILSLVIAAGLGFVSAYMTIETRAGSGAVENGAWSVNTNIGSEAADPYVKSYVALHGLLALNKTEAIYFSATRDSDGKTLKGGCTYKVSGSALPTRWWTITAYGPDDYLIPGGDGHFAVSVNELGTGNFQFPIAPALEAGETGLVTAETDRFVLLLRAYNPEAVLVSDPASAKLPVIKEENCDD